eukprot:scaffold261844_cov18-Tisochrysis_lutea.AAC.2
MAFRGLDHPKLKSKAAQRTALSDSDHPALISQALPGSAGSARKCKLCLGVQALPESVCSARKCKLCQEVQAVHPKLIGVSAANKHPYFNFSSQLSPMYAQRISNESASICCIYKPAIIHHAQPGAASICFACAAMCQHPSAAYTSLGQQSSTMHSLGQHSFAVHVRRQVSIHLPDMRGFISASIYHTCGALNQHPFAAHTSLGQESVAMLSLGQHPFAAHMGLESASVCCTYKPGLACKVVALELVQGERRPGLSCLLFTFGDHVSGTLGGHMLGNSFWPPATQRSSCTGELPKPIKTTSTPKISKSRRCAVEIHICLPQVRVPPEPTLRCAAATGQLLGPCLGTCD